jgi:hypothetical protein
MSTQPYWSPMDDETADLLSLVADTHTAPARDANTIFLAACESDAAANEGRVSVNRVRLLVGDQIEHHRFSAMWAHHTGPGKAMRRDGWEVCAGSSSGNDGKPYPRRVWVGA